MATNWQIGDLIENRWQVYNVLKGGMGIVYVVYDHELYEPFAAKTFRGELFDQSPVIAHRFRQEAITWINLEAHQNITEALMVHTIGDKPYLFLEYVGGGDLSAWVGTPRLTEDLPQVLRFAIQICEGMAHALQKGVKAHRDLKPQNCLITQDGTLKITDFGLAKTFDDVGSSPLELTQPQNLNVGLSRTGAAAGTCTHMAPEQFDDAKHVDARADIYSFGIMLYQMAAGRLPFVGRTWEEYDRLHKRQLVPKLGGRASTLHGIVMRCLAKEADRRYGDFGEVRDELAKVYEELMNEEAPRALAGAALGIERLTRKGANLSELGRHEEALACHNQALALNPDHAVLWGNKGSTLHSMGRYEEALACHDRALELEPGDYIAWHNKGSILDQLGHYEEALMYLNRALEINPRLAKPWLAKGSALCGMGRYDEALACFDYSLELNPHHAGAWYNKGSLLGEMGQCDMALVCLDRALELNPRYQEAWFNKGITLAEIGRYEEALECFNRSLALNPSDQQAWCDKGSTLLALGRPEDTLACYDRALELNTHYPEAWFYKGLVLARDFQRYSEALTCFEKAHQSGHPQAAQATAMCRQMLGR